MKVCMLSTLELGRYGRAAAKGLDSKVVKAGAGFSVSTKHSQ